MLAATLEPGDSGAAVVDIRGVVVAVAFAISRTTPASLCAGRRRTAGGAGSSPTHACIHPGLPRGLSGEPRYSMKMHSPGHSSAASVTASSMPSGTTARPSWPAGLSKTLSPSLT